ncbi:MAG: hypothetical protein COZ44_03110, partial [Sulfurimonas sp. CG_4_10_14_3_um_filter_36_910]
DLIGYDYILFGASFFLFLLFIILGMVLRRKTALSIIILLFAFLTLILGPTLGYVKMHNTMFKNSTNIVSQKELTFTQAIVLMGTLVNESNVDFKSCKITASLYKTSANKLKNYLYSFKAFQEMSILEDAIQKGETREFKLIIEPFTYTKEYNISLGAKCK